MICVVSGIFLAIPYDVDNAYTSISLMLLLNPAATLFRNMHYWSANFFLVFSLIHIWDHFSRKAKIKLKSGIWLRLSIGVLIILLAMLTGFLLKADADSLQARRILNDLVSGIPFIGSLLSASLLGTSDSLQVIYVHHIATFTLFITIIIMEHNRTIWPGLKETVWVTVFIMIFSLIFSTPLHDNLNPVIKGPWYFVGLQEILHWLSTPQVSLLLIILLIVLIFMVPFGGARHQFITKRALLILTIIYLLLTITGYFFRGPNWKFITPSNPDYAYYIYNPFRTNGYAFTDSLETNQVNSSPEVFDRKEGCLACHRNVEGFSASHNPQAVGCYSCHGGNPLTMDKDNAHKNMELIPGNLAHAERSCGTTACHPEIVDRINTGLMATLSGMISVDRYVFDEQLSPDELTSIHHLGNSAADMHLRNLCVKCHLGNPKTETGPVDETSRGGGCLACHLNYDEHALQAFHRHEQKEQDTLYLSFHPSVDLQVNNEHCFGCHSRSGRISTNYEGWHETTLKPEEADGSSNYRLVEEFRVFRKMEDDVHHRGGMDCIDCHNSYELMGDGNSYRHEEQQEETQCTDCHTANHTNTVKLKDFDQESAVITSLRFSHAGEKIYLATAKRNHPMINTFVQNDSAFLITKNSHQTKYIKPPASVCTRGEAHSNLSCSSCHSGWAPSCIGCHNTFDKKEPGYDMLENKFITGTWVEYVGEYHAHAPALGYRENDTEKTVIPVVPGMILTIDKQSYDPSMTDTLLFHRLYAPSAPHTTQAEGRNCKSCHNNPVALGYGQGTLQYSIDQGKGKWIFRAKYSDNPNDGLPEDAWTGFLQERTGKMSTRTDVRPFTIEEQKKILTVGACLTCHEDNSDIMKESLIGFKKVLNNKKPECILPFEK